MCNGINPDTLIRFNVAKWLTSVLEEVLLCAITRILGSESHEEVFCSVIYMQSVNLPSCIRTWTLVRKNTLWTNFCLTQTSFLALAVLFAVVLYM